MTAETLPVGGRLPKRRADPPIIRARFRSILWPLLLLLAITGVEAVLEVRSYQGQAEVGDSIDQAKERFQALTAFERSFNAERSAAGRFALAGEALGTRGQYAQLSEVTDSAVYELRGLSQAGLSRPDRRSLEKALALWRTVGVQLVRLTGAEDDSVRTELVRQSVVYAAGVVRAVDDLTAIVLVELLERQKNASSLQQKETVIAGTAFAVSIATLGLLLVASRRRLTRPIQELSAAVRELALGDSERPVHALGGPSELDELALGVEGMRQQLVQRGDEVDRADEALEQRSPVVAAMRGMLTANIPELPNVELSGRLVPAEGHVAGDWWDVLGVDGPIVTIALADVMGHGPEAGLFALRLKQTMKNAVLNASDLAGVLSHAMGCLGDFGGAFATGVILQVDMDTGECVYVNAGHPPPIIFRQRGEGDQVAIERLEPTGPLLGPLAEARWTVRPFILETGDLLLGYSDGVVEARDNTGSIFGLDRLIETVNSPDLFQMNPEQIVGRCISDVRNYAGHRCEDDMVVIALRQGLRG